MPRTHGQALIPHSAEDDDPFTAATREGPTRRPSSPPNRSRPASVASTARTSSRPGTALARPASQASTHSRTASIPTPDPIAPRTRGRPGGADATTAIAASRSAAAAKDPGLHRAAPLRSGTHPTTPADPPRATTPRTVPAPAANRRIQPLRAASYRSMENGLSVRPVPRTAGAATSRLGPTTTRGPATRPATTGDKDVKGTKSITSRSVASKPSSQPRAAGPSSSKEARQASANGELDLIGDIPLEGGTMDADYFFDV